MTYILKSLSTPKFSKKKKIKSGLNNGQLKTGVVNMYTPLKEFESLIEIILMNSSHEKLFPFNPVNPGRFGIEAALGGGGRGIFDHHTVTSSSFKLYRPNFVHR